MKITIKDLEGILTPPYQETIVTDQSVQKIGMQEEVFLTDQKYLLTVNRGNHPRYVAMEQPIQALIYDKYRLEFVTKSTYSIELMKHGTVEIEDDDGESYYSAIVTDIEKNQIAGRLWAVTVEFYDVNPENYVASIIEPIQYLRSDFVVDKYPVENLVRLNVNIDGGDSYDIFSIILPDRYTDQPVTDPVTTANGISVRPAVISKQYIEGLFFGRNETVQNILSVLPLAGNYKSTANIVLDSVLYPMIETPEFEVTKIEGSDIWQLKVKYVYNLINHYEYAQ